MAWPYVMGCDWGRGRVTARWGCCCWSSVSQGFSAPGAATAASGGLRRSMASPVKLALPALTGVRVREGGFAVSPSWTNASIARSRFPSVFLSTTEFRLVSGKPISLRVASFESKVSSWLRTAEPRTLEGLFALGGDARPSDPVRDGDKGGVNLLCFWCRVKVALAERKLMPNFLLGFGGSGGGWSSCELVLRVAVYWGLCRVGCIPLAEEKALSSYFWRINLSIAPSASSMSMGMSGWTFRGLNRRLALTLPTRFIRCQSSVLGLELRPWSCTHVDLVAVPRVHAQ